MMKSLYVSTCIILALIVCSPYMLLSTTFDNRYIPFLQSPYMIIDGRPSHTRIDAFATTSREGFGSSDTEIPLPELEGKFDQGYLADALVLIGKDNPLRPEWRGESIPWKMSGKIQSHGLTFGWQQEICSFFSVGIYWGMINMHSSYNFALNLADTTIALLPGDIQELETIRRSMLTSLEITDNHAHQVGMLDADVYMRFGYHCKYIWKFRYIDTGIKIGALLPAAARKNPHSYASIPLAGDGHYGMYTSVDVLCELKEDWSAGCLLRLEKRFSRQANYRFPAGKELPSFGAIQARAKHTPGITIVCAPYVVLENLRKGFGVRARYTLIKHTKDCWSDIEICPEGPTAQLKDIINRSDWAIDYISLTAFYDFGKESIQRTFQPIIHVTWDIPTLFLIGYRVAKTHKLSLGVEWHF